jgi:tetratricopeptide (TPR) repeat protein
MSHGSQITSTFKALAAALSLLACTGCAGSIEHWIVNTRIHQGDVSLERGNLADAELSYRLALNIDPHNERARAGYVASSADLAQAQYSKGDFEDALLTIAQGLKYDPSSVRLAAEKGQIEDAKLKREIVISNYPTYRDAGVAIQQAYANLDTSNKTILAHIKRFSYTFDPEDLTTAIKSSYDLELEVARNTNRLINYRQVVSSGVPEETHAPSGVNGASLLPLP